MNEVLYREYIRELELDFAKPDSLLNKIKFCSFLVCCGASVELESYPSNNRDFRTGNTGLQLTVGSPLLRALIPFFYMDGNNPVRVRGSYLTGQATIEYDGKEFFEVAVLPEIETGSKNINSEFETLIAAIPEEPYGMRNCYYHSIGKPCGFCILTRKRVHLGPKDLVEAYNRVTQIRGREPQVLLTGGTGSATDRGLSQYVPYIAALRSSFPQARTAIEAAPPKDVYSVDTLIALGIDTFSANIEFFSKKTRKKLLPGKSEIGLEEYKKVLGYCEKAGVKTFSALIAGPEAEEDTLQGVEYLSGIGVPTNLLCLRPFPGSRIGNHPRTSPARFLKVTKEANMIMDQSGLLESLSEAAGCGSCGACSMEMNLYRLSRNSEGEDFYDIN